jgi:A/G-specific adenine glycosylase
VGRSAIAPFHERLLAWWDQNGRKDLPWQNPRTPYRVWISEIMLQQTHVSTVIPYFRRWMNAFPDIETLATASLDDVLAHWAGLGYYARARNLHKAAGLCLEHHGGALPLDAEGLTRLPGIGASTANAIVSQSQDRPAAVLDGNVRRLLARHAAVEGYTGSTAVQRRLWAEAEARLPADRGADYTQAVMDLGALVCARSNPDCNRCPVGADCQALSKGRVGVLPAPKPRPRVGTRQICMLILRDDEGRVLLEKRPPSGIWGGLWCLPEGENTDLIGQVLGIEVEGATALPSFEHRLSHVRMGISPYMATAGNAHGVKCSTERDWFDRDGQAGLGLPKPVDALLERLNNGEFE